MSANHGSKFATIVSKDFGVSGVKSNLGLGLNPVNLKCYCAGNIFPPNFNQEVAFDTNWDTQGYKLIDLSHMNHS